MTAGERAVLMRLRRRLRHDLRGVMHGRESDATRLAHVEVFRYVIFLIDCALDPKRAERRRQPTAD